MKHFFPIALIYVTLLWLPSFGQEKGSSKAPLTHKMGSILTPSVKIEPDTLIAQITDCSDSAHFNFTLYNVGTQVLSFRDRSNTAQDRKIQVAVLATAAQANESTTIYNAINGKLSNTVKYIYPTTTAALNSDLQGVDVVAVPFDRTGYPSTFSSSLKGFLNRGGGVVFCFTDYTAAGAYDIMTHVRGQGLGSTVSVDLTAHPIAQGLPTSGINKPFGMDRVKFIDTNSLAQIMGAVGPAEAAVAAKPYGPGRVVHIQYTYSQANSDMTKILQNAVEWSANRKPSLPNNPLLQPDSGMVAAGDSVQLRWSVPTAGLPNGTYSYSLLIGTNDPTVDTLLVPVLITVNGGPEQVILDSTCLSFDTLAQGRSSNPDSFLIYNRGCDTLALTSWTSGSPHFFPSNLPCQLAPGDTGAVIMTFRPLGVGVLRDTILIQSSDTAFAICVSGTGTAAALPRSNPDTIRHTMQLCESNDSTQFFVLNRGQVGMNFHLEFGHYRDSTPVIPHRLYQSDKHTFNGLPKEADTIRLTFILHGDYDDPLEFSAFDLEGAYSATVQDNNRHFINDTVVVDVTGNQVQNILGDGQLEMTMSHSLSVDTLTGSYYQVKIDIIEANPWLGSRGVNAGAIPAQDSILRGLNIQHAIPFVGTYLSYATVRNNSPGYPRYQVPVLLTLIFEPELEIKDSCVAFPVMKVGDTARAQLTIRNPGCQTLMINQLRSFSGHFKHNVASTGIYSGDSTTLTIEIIPTQAGAFTDSLVISSNAGSKTLCLSARAYHLAQADFNWHLADSCAGSVGFDNSNSQHYTSLLWDFGDGGSSVQQNPTHTYNQAGSYRVSLQTSNALGFDTISKLVTVNPLKPNFGISNDTIQLSDTAYFSDSTAGAVTWIWDFGDGSSSTQQNPQHKYNTQGLFTVRLTVIDGRSCSRSVTKQILVENRIGLEEALLDQALSVYPNPNTGRFMLEYDQGNLADLSFGILDAQGRLIKRFKGQPGEKQAVELELPAGTYLLQINRSGATVGQRRLIIFKP